MAAMIWDEQAQAFTEAETPMKYDQTVVAWTETTGMAWDNEAQAWTEKWTSGVRAYVYGAALETVTIRKNGIVVATVQTDSSGCSTEQITLSGGTYTLTGSVSGWTEEQTVDENTDRFRAMPGGKIIYWYGYKDADIDFDYPIIPTAGVWKAGTVSVNTNDMVCLAPTYPTCVGISTHEKLNISQYRKYKAIYYQDSIVDHGGVYRNKVQSIQGGHIDRIFNSSSGTFESECELSDNEDSYFIGCSYCNNGKSNAIVKIYAIWLE